MDEQKVELGAVLDEDSRKSSLAELPDDCSIVDIRNLAAGGGDG